ncbi:hypothetical protein GGI15_004251 [Coemansia interrupta]|uniref:Uncharacterized protein n=1 Tax=Coemansia interrupta TaxID=1126814 RepID=A0A9W8H8J0_9FUNG|nr:hypothetical protein GGI15_004251 [Coemansia interrupta]
MDSESEADEVLSPVQRAQRVAGTYSASHQLSSQSPRSRSQSQSQSQSLSQSQSQQRPGDQVSPIRSLTEALALSPRGAVNRQYPQSQRQQRSMTAFGIRTGRGQSSGSGSGDSGDGAMTAGDGNGGSSGAELMLQNVLARVNQVYRCCERVLQLQEHSSLRIEHLEEAVERINQSLTPLAAASAAAATSSAALAEHTTDTGSYTESAFQAGQGHMDIMAVSGNTVAGLGRSPMHQGRDRYASPSPGYVSPTVESSGHSFMHQVSTSAPAGLQSSPRSATSSVYRNPYQHLHVRSTPYSGQTSPRTPATARGHIFGGGSLTTPAATTGHAAGSGVSQAYLPQQLSQAHHQSHYHQQQHRRHRDSISRRSPPNHRVYRPDSSRHTQQSLAGSGWPPHQPPMQQPQRDTAGEPADYGSTQPQLRSFQLSHPNSAAAFGQGFQSATGSAGSMHPQTYSAHQQQQMQDVAGYPSTGMKRQRVGDGIGAAGMSTGASGLGSGSGSGGGSTGRARLREPRWALEGRAPAAAAAAGVGDRNPDARPTNAWLTGQRHYKTGQLRLLTLDSFYPSDTAMLQVFREHDDFTPEQIEQYGSTLLSWARGWLRYNRNAVLRHLLLSKGTLPLEQLAEVLQQDMQSREDFTTPENLRRCALLRATHYEWHASRKMGNKSASVFRDYESALREIQSLPTVAEQEARWEAVLQEEQVRRAAFIRDSRQTTTTDAAAEAAADVAADATTDAAAGGSGSGSGSTPAVAGARGRRRGSSMLQAAGTSMSSSSSSSLASVVATGHISRQQSMDWPAYQAAETSSAGPRDFAQQHQQHFSLQQHQQQQQRYSQHHHQQQQRYSQQQHHHHLVSGDSGNTDMYAAVGKDDDSEMSVNISPEPGNR